MPLWQWLVENWFELLQSLGILGGLLFTAYTIQKDERARKIGNLLAVNEHYRDIWKELYTRPDLIRVFRFDVDLSIAPVEHDERLFVRLLILHLNAVYTAMNAGMFVALEGLKKDIHEFFAYPIPESVWEEIRHFQNDAFVQFVESNRKRA